MNSSFALRQAPSNVRLSARIRKCLRAGGSRACVPLWGPKFRMVVCGKQEETAMAQPQVDPSVFALDWQTAHQELVRIAHHRAELDRDEARWLLVAFRGRAHQRLGFASFAQYAERTLGYKPRTTEERPRVAEALEHLPELAEALQSGRLSWTAVREPSRVATRETESDWLKAAQGRTVREVEALVSVHRPGDTPAEPKDPSLRKHALHFEVSAETLALFREATEKLRRDAGQPLDDDALLLMVARQTLGGPKDPGRANYQIAVSVCNACGQGAIRANGDAIPVSREVIERAECDGQKIDMLKSTHVGQPPRATQQIPPALRRHIKLRDQHCVVPGCRHSQCDLHHLEFRAEGGEHSERNVCLLCPAHHRAIHEGRLIVEGNMVAGLSFHHADGTRYGEPVSPKAADHAARAFQALTHMGFRPKETRQALERIRAQADPNLTLQGWLQQALRLLTEHLESGS